MRELWVYVMLLSENHAGLHPRRKAQDYYRFKDEGDNDVPPTTVTVTVLLDGIPLTSGRIFFHRPMDQFAGAKIKAGKCMLDDVPAGNCTVTVESEGLPAALSSVEQASLRVEIVAGKNDFTFQLLSN